MLITLLEVKKSITLQTYSMKNTQLIKTKLKKLVIKIHAFNSNLDMLK